MMLRSDATSLQVGCGQKTKIIVFSDWAGWIEGALFVSLAGLALCAPLSTKGAVNAFRAATVFWLILICTRKFKVLAQPLVRPLLLFLLFSGISTALSSEPLLSWGRMRTVTLMLLAVLMAQATFSSRQLKILVGLLLGACLISVIYTEWQYTFGIGVEPVVNAATASVSLAQLGLQKDDIIQGVNGKPTRTPRQLL